MRGYAYLDLDGNIVVKSPTYIETENPLFFSENSEYIVQLWRFDTDDLVSMRNMLLQFKSLQLKVHQVQPFLESIGFELSRLKS